MHSDLHLPEGLLGVLKDLWPFLCHDSLSLDSDPTSAEALDALANYEPTCDNINRTDSTVPEASHPEVFLDSLPELSDSESLSESETSELHCGMGQDYAPFLNVELGESFDMSMLSILLTEVELPN